MASKVYQLIHEYWNEEPIKLRTMSVGFITVCGWYINILAFCYSAARLSVYHISTAYITDNSNVIYEIIFGVASGIVICMSNVIMYTLCRGKNYVQIMLIVLLEMAVIWCGIVCTAFSQPMNVFMGFVKFNAEQKRLIIVLLLVCVLLINFCLIGEVFSKITSVIENWFGKKGVSGEEEKKVKSEIDIRSICVAAIISMALLMILANVLGQSSERQNSEYKVIEANERIERNCVSGLDTKYYAVVFENQNVYIICPLRPLEDTQDDNCEKKNNELDSNEWYIECDVTQEVNKIGIPTRYKSGIHHIDHIDK